MNMKPKDPQKAESSTVSKLRAKVSQLKAISEDFRSQLKAMKENEERYLFFLGNFQGIVYQAEVISFKPTFMGGSVKKITGYQAEEFLEGSVTWEGLIHPEDKALVVKGCLSMDSRPGYVSKNEYRIIRKDGSIRWVSDACQKVKSRASGHTILQGSIYDITDRVRIEHEIKDSEKKYRSLVESTTDSIYLVDRELRYIFVNRHHIKRIGLPEDGYAGIKYSDIHSPEESRWFEEKIRGIFKKGQSMQFEYRSARDGRFFLQTFSPVKDSEGKTEAVTVVSKDITRLKQMEEGLRTLSLTDELTGLYNRRGFQTFAEQQLKLASRLKKRLVMVYTDMDNLKGINDRWGHEVGDQALIDASRILKDTFRESDIISRLGGDEFAVLMIESQGKTSDVLISRLRRKIDKYNKSTDFVFRLSMSAGVVVQETKGEDPLKDMLVRADKMMYEQKKSRG